MLSAPRHLANVESISPQPVVVSQPVTTQCYTSGGVTQCVSQ